MTTVSLPTPARSKGRIPQRTVLLVASFGAFLAFLDATIVNVAFPEHPALVPGLSICELSWILNAYSIVFAAFLVVSGRLADLLGRRWAFISGVLVFTLASALCAASGSVGFLVGARVLQALGAAILVPASLALVVQAFPAAHRSHAVGLWGASAALASGLGPPIGGALVEAGGWRWAFLVNIPFGCRRSCRAAPGGEPRTRTTAYAGPPRRHAVAPCSGCSPSAWSRGRNGAGRAPP